MNPENKSTFWLSMVHTKHKLCDSVIPKTQPWKGDSKCWWRKHESGATNVSDIRGLRRLSTFCWYTTDYGRTNNGFDKWEAKLKWFYIFSKQWCTLWTHRNADSLLKTIPVYTTKQLCQRVSEQFVLFSTSRVIRWLTKIKKSPEIMQVCTLKKGHKRPLKYQTTIWK